MAKEVKDITTTKPGLVSVEDVPPGKLLSWTIMTDSLVRIEHDPELPPDKPPTEEPPVEEPEPTTTTTTTTTTPNPNDQ